MKMLQGSPLIHKKYALLEKIGQGMFGEIYHGKNMKTMESVAIKSEPINTPYRLLKHETTILKYLYDHGCRKIPMVYWYGVWEERTLCIMSFFECSLEDYCKMSSSNEKLNRIMIQCINILESIHENYVLHRDIKPQNFMIRNGELYAIDFGLATFYVNDKVEHIENSLQKNENIVGSPKYASYNIHNGEQCSRRDDLISLGYMYICLHSKELPWDNLQNLVHDDISELSIYHNKNIQRKELKSWLKLEPFFLKINQIIHKYLNYCYGLKYGQEPNYNGLIQLFI